MLDEPDADIANIINNFLIEAQALRASQQSLAAKVDQQTAAMTMLAEQMKKTQGGLLQIAKSGVSVRLDPHAQQLEQIGGTVVQSIATAARRAEGALSAKLREAETSKTNGLVLICFVACLSAITTVALVLWVPSLMQLLPLGGR